MSIPNGPEAARRFTAIDVHAEGEPGRVITGGVGDLAGDSLLERMLWMETNADDVRRVMLREPRGYPALCCNAIVAPSDPAADAAFIIMEQTEYPAMSGSNLICVATALLETGMLPMTEPTTSFVLEAPAGLISVDADCEAGKATMVRFSQRSGLCDGPRRSHRGAPARRRERRHRLGWDVLCHRGR